LDTIIDKKVSLLGLTIKMAISVKLLITVLVVVELISYSFGDDIAKRLKHRYKSNRDWCHDKHKHRTPAYECSGIMIRGVGPKLALPWDMKEKNKRKEAFSMAYLRHDQVFSRFPKDYTSGFIIYPHLKAPHGKKPYRVFCSFPLDAWTDERHHHGCGTTEKTHDKKSDTCRKQNIRSFHSWKTHFKKPFTNTYTKTMWFRHEIEISI